MPSNVAKLIKKHIEKQEEMDADMNKQIHIEKKVSFN